MKDERKKELSKDEVERIFESTWNNWASRRKCEATHTPEYIKRINKSKSNEPKKN